MTDDSEAEDGPTDGRRLRGLRGGADPAAAGLRARTHGRPTRRLGPETLARIGERWERTRFDEPAAYARTVMVRLRCEPPVASGALGSAEGRIWLWSPMDIVGDPESDDVRISQPFVYVEGVVSKLQGERTLELPVMGPGDSGSYPITVFIADSQGEDGNEVSSAVSEATGTVRVLEASCDPTPVLRLEVAATLGSEEGKGPLDPAGAVR